MYLLICLVSEDRKDSSGSADAQAARKISRFGRTD
jgi:hypothetical protein